jgi:CDP-glucose 4,6-dehydratase
MVRELVNRGADVVAVVRDSVPGTFIDVEGLRDRISVCRGDVTNASLVRRVLAEYEVQTVFHLAAQTIVPIANKSPISTFESNIAGTWTVLEGVRLGGSEVEVVVASSDKAYGPSASLPYREDYSLHGRSPYDVSKSCADLLALTYAASYGMNLAVARCGNIYGGGDLNWSRIVPGTIRSVLEGRAPVLRSDGSFIRDYVYVEDVVDAYMAMAEAAGRPGVRGEAFNFSPQRPLTVLEITRAVLAAMDRSDLEPVILDSARAEIKDQYLDAGKAARVLGWEPRYGLEEGLEATVAWYRTFLRDHA